jgi:hypothetical protein
MKNNINYDLYGKNIKVITTYGTEISGIFIDDFEEEKEFAVNNVIIKYNEVKEMIEIKDEEESK